MILVVKMCISKYLYVKLHKYLLMQVKGTGIKTTKEFVKSHFESEYSTWIENLPLKSKELYTFNVEFTGWFPIQEAYIQPLENIISMFYKGNSVEGGKAIGRFSADYALKGVYKVFLLVASPQFLMRRASKIMKTFYKPCKINVAENGNKSVVLTILRFDKMNEALEHRIGSWYQRALELANCKRVTYTIQKTLTKNDSATEIVFNWN